MINKKPLLGLHSLHFLFCKAINGDDNHLYLGQSCGFNQGFKFIGGYLRQPVIFLFSVSHDAYSLLAGTYTIADLPNCFTSTTLSNELLATTSSKRGNVTLLFRLTDTSLYPNRVVITSLLMLLLVMVSTIACTFILCPLFVYLTMITLYSNKLYTHSPQLLGGRLATA